MRIIRLLLRHDRQPEPAAPPPAPAPIATTPPLPPGLTDRDRRELANARRRIPRKWRALERMLADYAGAEATLRGRT